MKKMFSFKIVEKEKHFLKRVNLTRILFFLIENLKIWFGIPPSVFILIPRYHI